jgi:hypothetical protein
MYIGFKVCDVTGYFEAVVHLTVYYINVFAYEPKLFWGSFFGGKLFYMP